ncbi:MAG: type I DNA topoisomerase [Planctomycetes bacterium]|nr:type I DNA topoisomerase [Planctomycetota bacterium]MBI3834382.1 type I DNA topoisomerase [Planctomycetota bacterium]
MHRRVAGQIVKNGWRVAKAKEKTQTTSIAKSASNGKALVIVESPAKAKTINKYLGSGYEVMASMGHVRDLPPNDFGIDLARNFEPVYGILSEKRRTVSGLRKAAEHASTVYLATDLDREGEAIAWHLAHALDLDEKTAKRVVFNEITKTAIQAAFAEPHTLDMDKVNAQQARRILDRIVGYLLSPLLQQKIAKGLSAGRVQSVAVRLIVEREKEIRAFVPEESWKILGCFGTNVAKALADRQAWAKFIADGKDGESHSVKTRNAWLSKHHAIFAELVKVGGEDFDARNADVAMKVAQSLGFVLDSREDSDFAPYKDKGLKTVTLHGHLDSANSPEFKVSDVQTRRTTSRPNPPFTTASIQQAASSYLGFSPSRTMRIAQQLYEGVDIGGSEGPVGLITYMRTDSTNLSQDSINAVRKMIGDQFGDRYLPDKPNFYAQAKRAQEAHEAIRPTDIARAPEAVRDSLTAEQAKLYDLIWRRFVACQMTPAEWDSTTVFINANISPPAQGLGHPNASPLDKGGHRGVAEATFKATGRRLVFDGFQRVMGISDDGDVVLPELAVGAPLAPLHIEPKQQYTSPPARYTEAALVKKLEAEGIGRPSTYAAIIQTVQDRGYVDLIEKKLRPTARGEIVTQRLVEHFPDIMDVKFTSYMEDELDKIEEAHLDWVHVLREFYEPFKASLDKAQVDMEKSRAEPSEYTCKECGKPMVYRLGKNGRFLSCTGFPECRAAMNVDADGKPIPEIVGEHPCSLCGREMIVRKSRLGSFLGCTGYPDCTNTLPCDEAGNALRKVKPEDVHEKCSDCGSPMAVKWGRGKAFFGCTNYPKCKSIKPVPTDIFIEKPKPQDAGVRCDKCGRPVVIRKSRRGPFLSCSGFPKCRNAMPMEKLDELKAKNEAGEVPDAPVETNGRAGKSSRAAKSGKGAGRNGAAKVDVSTLGTPPKGFAWTRTGRPVVEVWPEDKLKCPDCGSEVILKSGRFGPYFSCTGYPKCSFVANLRGEAKKRAEIEMPQPARPKPVPTDIACDECGESMLIRTGRSGPFLGCSKYPKCKFAKPLPEGYTAEALAAGS